MIFYVSNAKLKSDTPLGSQVDENIIRPYMTAAQDRFILPILGTDLDTKLKADIVADTLADHYLALVQLIQPALVWHTFVEVAYGLSLRFSNNSIYSVTNEQGNNASPSDVKLVMDRAKDLAEFYTKRIVTYLCEHGSAIPEYNSNDAYNINPSKNTYYSHLNLERTRKPTDQILAAIGATQYL